MDAEPSYEEIRRPSSPSEGSWPQKNSSRGVNKGTTAFRGFLVVEGIGCLREGEDPLVPLLINPQSLPGGVCGRREGRKHLQWDLPLSGRTGKGMWSTNRLPNGSNCGESRNILVLEEVATGVWATN